MGYLRDGSQGQVLVLEYVQSHVRLEESETRALWVDVDGSLQDAVVEELHFNQVQGLGFAHTLPRDRGEADQIQSGGKRQPVIIDIIIQIDLLAQPV